MEPVEEERSERVERQVASPDTRPYEPLPRPVGYAEPAGPVQPAAKNYYASTTSVRGYDRRLERVVWFVAGVVCTTLAIRFFMKLLGASYQSDFVRFLYGVTGPLVAPFHGIFQASGSGSYVLEPESLIAIAIYALIGWAVVALIRILRAPRSRPAL